MTFGSWTYTFHQVELTPWVKHGGDEDHGNVISTFATVTPFLYSKRLCFKKIYCLYRSSQNAVVSIFPSIAILISYYRFLLHPNSEVDYF